MLLTLEKIYLVICFSDMKFLFSECSPFLRNVAHCSAFCSAYLIDNHSCSPCRAFFLNFNKTLFFFKNLYRVGYIEN